ncbi:alpha/beta hydrolase [Chitinophaga sp. sic0106]|uniref:alpha/beta hydrolase n=1 Tax=Chitinophaga sp. sic0106 TaxID=2854785 RepID=UPI001C492940|nr:alpha/beta hydrolase-fold protein [Chitinophaga sp. sic0106]MBV7533106.1 alpha/beta hydrolase [Chitinophaga sp. sic0106]
MSRFLNLFIIFIFLHAIAAAQTNSTPITIGQSVTLWSDILQENRNINIYLPEDYNAADTVTYPVIFVLDGGIEEDFFHIAGIVRFNTQPWIARFPRSIVVGIENTNRRRDFTFAVPNTDFIEKAGFKKSSFPQYGKSAKYIGFLEKELQPFLRKNFHTNEQRTVIGESLAGLLATEILLRHPQLFSTYIIISPSLWWDDESLLNTPVTASHTRVYIGAPNKAEDKRMYEDAVKLYDHIKSTKNIKAVFDYLPEELHSTVIHQAVYNAFKQLYPKTALSQ